MLSKLTDQHYLLDRGARLICLELHAAIISLSTRGEHFDHDSWRPDQGIARSSIINIARDRTVGHKAVFCAIGFGSDQHFHIFPEGATRSREKMQIDGYAHIKGNTIMGSAATSHQ